MMAASDPFFRSEFDEFLYAAIGTESNGMALSVLSALARLNINPWEEAAELFELPKDTAAKRLLTLIARSPVRGPAHEACNCRQLVELSPRRPRPTVSSKDRIRGPREIVHWGILILLAAANNHRRPIRGSSLRTVLG
jgi:hypothetical protein